MVGGAPPSNTNTGAAAGGAGIGIMPDMPVVGAGWPVEAGAPAGGMTMGLPGTGAGIGIPGCIVRVATAVDATGFTAAWRPEFSETKVAQPRTSAIAAPAARPRLSRRDFWVATTG
jgi:hypothetical protein